MRGFIALILFVAALSATAASMAMNYTFWTAQGVDVATSRVLGCVSIVVDVFKATLPLAISWASAERMRLGASIATCLFCGCLSFSFISALGFSAWLRGSAAGGREAQALRYKQAVKELDGLDQQLTGIASSQPALVVDAAIAREKLDRRWESSNECKDATVSSSRSFCANLADLQVEAAGASERQILEARRLIVRREIDGLVQRGAGLESDMQAGILSRLSGFPVPRIENGLVLLVAVIVELSAGFGLFLASLPLRNRPNRWNFHHEDRRSRIDLAKRLAIAKAASRPTRVVRKSNGQLMIE